MDGHNRTVAIIQARMGSSRLYGKILMDLCGKSVLERVIDRVKKIENLDDIVIATTRLSRDDIVIDVAKHCKLKYYRGSEEDVLSRYYYAATKYDAGIVVRITSDCPLYDPFIGNEIISFFKKKSYDMVTNVGALDISQRTYPRGLDTEVFSFSCLKDAFHNAKRFYQREHVTPFIYEKKENNIYYYKSEIDYSEFRWTLDTKEDLEFIQKVYEHFCKERQDFYFHDIVELLENKPELTKINEEVRQKSYKA